MVILQFHVESIDTRLKMAPLPEKEGERQQYTPVEMKTITLTLQTDNPEEWAYFVLGEIYNVTIERKVS